MSRAALYAGIASLVTACGGGGVGSGEQTAAPTSDIGRFTDALRAAGPIASAMSSPVEGRRVRLSGIDSVVGADLLMDWAEYRFPELFPRGTGIRYPAVEYLGQIYNAREYRGPWGSRYLGVTPDGRVFGLGDWTANQLTAYGVIADWASSVRSDRCAFDPAACGAVTTEPAGPHNGCSMTATRALVTGNRLNIRSAILDEEGGGETTIDSTVEGAAAFDGRSTVALRSLVSTSMVVAGTTVNSSADGRSYALPGPQETITAFGAEGTSTTPGVTIGGITVPGSTSRSVMRFDPPYTDLQFTLPLGQSMTLLMSAQTMVDGGSPVASAIRTTYLYEARETIEVRGRRYEACRYRETSENAAGTYSLTWYVVGYGVPARIDVVKPSTTGAATTSTVQELISATFNGSPI